MAEKVSLMKRSATSDLENGKPAKALRKDITDEILNAVDLLGDYDFKLYWEQELKGKLSFELLVTTKNGKSVFSRLCKLEDSGPFLEVWQQYKDSFRLTHFLDRSNKQFLLSELPLYKLSSSKALTLVLEHFKEDLTVEDLLTQTDKGVCLLDKVIHEAKFGSRDPFSSIWEQFKDQLTVDDFLRKVKNSSNLRRLAGLASRGRPQLFLKVFERFKGDFKAEHFLARSASWDVEYGCSILCELACVWPDLPHPDEYIEGEPFLTVFEQFKADLKLENLLEEYGWGHSLFSVMYERPKTKIVLYHHLAQSPGIIPERMIVKDDNDLKKRIVGRNNFFNQLEKIRTLKPGGLFDWVKSFYGQSFDDELNKLVALAQIASDSGYRNAHYDLGRYLNSIGRDWNEAFEKVPVGSIHYQTVCVELAECYLGQAISSPPDLRKQLLEKVIAHTRDMTHENLRKENINRIASYYEFGDTYHTLPGQALEAITPNTPIAEYFQLFDRKKNEMVVKSSAGNELKATKPVVTH